MNLLYSYILLWLVCFVSAVFMYKSLHFNYSLDHIHHYYIGYWFISLGIIYEQVFPGWDDSIQMIMIWVVLYGIGFILMFDDIIQHYRQVKHPDDTSPIHDLVQLIKWLWDK